MSTLWGGGGGAGAGSTSDVEDEVSHWWDGSVECACDGVKGGAKVSCDGSCDGGCDGGTERFVACAASAAMKTCSHPRKARAEAQVKTAVCANAPTTQMSHRLKSGARFSKQWVSKRTKFNGSSRCLTPGTQS